MLYETPVAPHCPTVGPDITAGTGGNPEAMPLHRWALGVPHGPSELTQTVEPGGTVAGKSMVADVPLLVINDPGTEHVQIYDVAPVTAGMLNAALPLGHTKLGPEIIPG